MRLGINLVSNSVGLLVLGLCCISSSAQHMNAADAPCKNAGSNAEITQCFVDTNRAADKRLNEFYGQIKKAIDGEEWAKLQAAQRLWIQFRDANCLAEQKLYEGGSAASMVYYACLEADTRQRTKELKTMYGWRIEKFQ